jgi:hypothetical protein
MSRPVGDLPRPARGPRRYRLARRRGPERMRKQQVELPVEATQAPEGSACPGRGKLIAHQHCPRFLERYRCPILRGVLTEPPGGLGEPGYGGRGGGNRGPFRATRRHEAPDMCTAQARTPPPRTSSPACQAVVPAAPSPVPAAHPSAIMYAPGGPTDSELHTSTATMAIAVIVTTPAQPTGAAATPAAIATRTRPRGWRVRRRGADTGARCHTAR